MISNTSNVYKLKASKSSKDVQDTDYIPSDDNYENNSIEEEAGDTNHRLHTYSRDTRDGRYSRGAGRSRSTEFRPSKTSERRGGYRGRGAGSSSGRRGDRDYADNFYNLKKFESGRSSETSGGYRGKCYEPEKKSEIKLNLPEDTRISKLLRRLSTETSQDNSLAISKKLLEVLLLPDNMPYVRKAFHILGESMYEILHVSPGPLAKLQAAKALGRMGYIMAEENDFDRYQHWLFSKMNNNYEEMQILLMKTFKETLALEAKKPVLECYVKNFINNLVSAIETTENAEIFKMILDILMSVVELYPNEFYEQFRDTTDLLFGWHVDHTQPLSNVEFISTNLQRVSQHFKYNLEFSVSLIENFLEDIINYASQVSDTGDSNSLDHVTVLILAMNTVLKCLDTSFHPSNNKYVKAEFVSTCLTRIIKTLTDALETFVPDNLTIAANDCISILLGYLDTKPQGLCTSVCNLIDLELALISDLSDNTIISMLLLISKVIKELSANLPIELIEKLIGPKSDIIKLRHMPFKNIQGAVICIYQSLLNLKNVSLLQEAYRYVLGDLEVIYKEIVPSIDSFTPNNPFAGFEIEKKVPAEQTLMFLLRCLSQLASASSIIVMWALKPSILELVGVNLKPYDAALSKNSPALQYCLLFLLYSHCKCYNHFISNSSLVTNKSEHTRFTLSDGLNINDVPNTSPNSGNFAIILDIIYNTLKIETSFEVTLLILQWLHDILANSEMYLESLYLCEKFLKVTDVLVKCGYHFNSQIVTVVCENLEKLLSNKALSWSSTFLTNICDLCKLHMNSNIEEIRSHYGALWSNIPWDIAIVELNKVNSIYNIEHKTTNSKDINNYMVYLAQILHLNGSVEGEMYAEQFKVLMNYLIKNEPMPVGVLEELFTCCWQLESDCQMNMELFYDLAINSRQVLNNWSTLEAAQFCVNYKLRTPLGKPNETFTKIEGALNHLGNDLLLLKKNNSKSVTTDGNKVRLLLHFVEHLEKSIYNAAEGTSMAIPPPSKVVRNFFIANTNTCNEWLSRIRMVVMHTSLHAGEASIALRHGQCLLKDLATTGKVDSIEFERLIMFLTLALLNLREPEALYGLYVWCKVKLNKKYAWVKSAADQASKKFEIAADGYKKFLTEAQQESDEKKIDQDLQNFINDQILVCYKELNNWVDLFEWHDQQESVSVENGKKYWFNTTSWECNKNMYNMEVENRPFLELSTWKYKHEEKTWSVFENLNMIETNLHNIAVTLVVKPEEDCGRKIDLSLELLKKSIQDHLILAPSEFLQNYSLLQYVATGLKNVSNNMPANTVFLVSENFENEISKIDSSILRKILWWSEYFGNIQNQGFNTFCSNLRLDIIKRARKEKNYKLAITNIFKFFKDKNLLVNKSTHISTVASDFLNQIAEFDIWTVDTARAMLEVIKLSYCHEDSHIDTFNLCASASTAISKYAEMFGIVELRKISSKILIKLASWLQINENVNITDMNSSLGKLIMVLPEIGLMENVSSIIPLNEMAIGKLLQFSVHQCLGLAKSWNAFGTWCYRWGRRIVDHSSDIKNNLTEEHCLEIKKLLPPDISEDDLTKIFLILSQTRTIIDEEDIDSNEINTSDMIKNQLMGVSILKNASDEQLRNMVQIWKSTQKRIYNYYALSAEAYFKYLHLAMNSDNVTRNTECYTITITLRLLRLIVKYALELQSILEEGLQSTPTQPWKVIIPQLFSRLNHPEGYVRHRVSDLLCRVAEDAPQLITFPAVVGALEGGLKFDFSEITLPKDCLSQNNESNEENELNEDDENYDSDSEESTNALQSCFKTMVDTLSKQDPETIAQVQMLVKELRRITLLWDELWLGTLAQHQSEITKRQQQLEYEIEKVNDNPNLSKEEKISLIAEKHRIITKPIVFILEQLLDVTSVEAETPHEKQFQEKYLDHIKQVIYSLKNPDHPEKPEDSLQPLRLLQKKFQQKFHKRASYSLKMQDIAPVLHSIKNTVIAMPGLATSGKQNVTISHVSNTVTILPTKTKPKKLVFYGSDGQTYTYLFKGLEDLHLDERIMQFLSIANTMMAQNSDPSGNNLYRARHYSVIPLGPRSGLISWVDGTTPVFALYKRWQQREMAKPNPKGSSSGATTVLRPSELFYNKLNPLLREHGVKNIENRKEWPLNVLKQVLTELMAETPSDLLAKELWCNSISPNVWWQVIKRYSYSVAVMSMIGYIIGLGDRHLDNVLVDLTSGDVVHIDYNVCFEKGKTLRVPEKVPFRLTPNIREALGATGVEGIFRIACENVLKTMRKGRETLLTLLEAFVYDPLIDWTVGGEVLAGTTFGGLTTSSCSTRQTKKELEREVTLSLFNVRCTEMRVEWNENRDEVMAEIPNLISNINKYIKQKVELDQTEEKLQDLHQQLALVKEAEAQGSKKHSLFKLPSKYDCYMKSQEIISVAKSDLEKIIKDCEIHLDLYNNLIGMFEKQQFTQWMVDLINMGEDCMHIFELVKEFLHNAGKDDVVVLCEQSEQEVLQLSQHLNLQTRKCIQIFQDYFSLLVQCPKNYMDSHRMQLFAKWARHMLETKSLQGCDAVIENFKEFLSSKHHNAPQIVSVAFTLDSYYKETLIQVNKLYDDLATLRTKEPNGSLEKLYSNAKIGISNFLQTEKGSVCALKFVIAGELIILNRNFITLEVTAHRAGDWLIKLMSREGDWFLDDLLLHSSRAVELIGNIPARQEADDQRFYQICNGIRVTNSIYKGLYDLNFNFHTIILPESIKKIVADEESVNQMLFELNQLIIDIGIPIPEIIVQLEKLLTCVLIQMDVSATYDYVVERIITAKGKFAALIPNQSETLSQGKMLLMGFNGLFEKLTQEVNNMINVLSNLDIPKSWKKLDHVKDARNIAPHIFNVQVRNILDNILFLKRIKVMSDFFAITREMCQSLKGGGSGILYTDEQLAKPVKQFTSEFVLRQVLGIAPEVIAYSICSLLQQLEVDVTHEIEQKDIGAEIKVPLDELYQKAFNVLLKENRFTSNVISQATSLETNLKLAWEKIQEPKKVEQKLTILQSSTLRMQNLLTIHNLMFDEVLICHNFASVRTKLIADMQTELATLQAIYNQLAEAKEKQQVLIEKAHQRLNWAKGANPNVGEISAAFEDAVKARDKKMNLEQKVATYMLTSCSVVLQYEFLRTTVDTTKEYDKIFLSYADKWRVAIKYMDYKADNMSLSEVGILTLLNPELVKDPRWLQKISEQITEMITNLQKKLAEQKEVHVTNINNSMLSLIDSFKAHYNVHLKLMSDVKNLIKTMTKIEDYSYITQTFVQEYRIYLEHFSSLFVQLKKEPTREVMEESLKHLGYLKDHTAIIYAGLLDLEVKKGLPSLTGEDSHNTSLVKKQESITKGQQRNAYAVNVWRRVKMKLEGRDPDPGRKCTAQEQVDYVIREATSLDNLALLYEGWTPWV